MISELRHAARQLAATPVATFTAILSLAVGIGANTAIFSVLNALLLQNLPIHQPSQLVRIMRADPGNPEVEVALSLVMIDAFRARQTVFSDLFAWSGGGISNIEANGSSYVGNPAQVTREYFSTLGLQPRLGRFFTSLDTMSVAVISHQCWVRRYDSDLAILGKTIRVDGVPLTIIGVGPEGYGGLNIDIADDVTTLLGFRDSAAVQEKTFLALEGYARLRPGTSIQQAQAELDTIWPAVRADSIPSAWTGAQRSQYLARKLHIQSAASGSSFLRRSYRKPLMILMAMVGVLLLVVCVNLANLTLARAAARRSEFAIRIGLGASRWHLVRQVLVESLLLSTIGASLGLWLAALASPYLLNRMWSGFVPLSLAVDMDIRVLAFTAGALVLTTVIFGLFPALRVGAIVEARRGVHMGFSAARWLVPAQIALSFTLVVLALMFGGTLNRLQRADVGFHRAGFLVAQMYPLQGAEAQGMAGRAAYFRDLTSRLSALPGVDAVSYSQMGPLLRYESKSPTSTSVSPESTVPAVFEIIGPGFFDLVGMRLLEGRDFSWNDTEGKQALCIISQSLARHLFPKGNAVGGRIDFGSKKNLEVVGVVNSASLWMPESREPMAVYRALLQEPTFNTPNVDISVHGSAPIQSAAIKKEIESLGHHTALRVQTIEERADRLLAAQHLVALLASLFGAVALLLAAIGLYGMLSQTVASRTGEIGIRMALGARPVDVGWLVIKQVLVMLFRGAIIAAPLTWAASQVVATSLFQTSALDPGILFAAFASLSLAALVATYLPVRRATKVNPIEVLR